MQVRKEMRLLRYSLFCMTVFKCLMIYAQNNKYGGQFR